MQKKKFLFYWNTYVSLMKSVMQLLWGLWKINHLPGPVVSIFGGSKLKRTSHFSGIAHDLAMLLIKHDISVITGGGSGIMESANCGATHAESEKSKARSIGITVKGLEEEPFNICAQEKIIVDYFFVRKWLMIYNSVAFAFFPGGFGTLDEFGEVVTLMQTKKLGGVPIVLIGKSYWGPYVKWLQEFPLEQGLITQKDLDLIQVTDDVDEALRLLKEHCLVCQ
jgi:uncharacterized protein (TIGR00730 family)